MNLTDVVYKFSRSFIALIWQVKFRGFLKRFCVTWFGKRPERVDCVRKKKDGTVGRTTKTHKMDRSVPCNRWGLRVEGEGIISRGVTHPCPFFLFPSGTLTPSWNTFFPSVQPISPLFCIVHKLGLHNWNPYNNRVALIDQNLSPHWNLHCDILIYRPKR